MIPAGKQSRTRIIVADIVASLLLFSLALEILHYSLITSPSLFFNSAAINTSLLGPAVYLTIRHASCSAKKKPCPFWRAFGVGFLASISVAIVVAGFRPTEPGTPSKDGRLRIGSS